MTVRFVTASLALVLGLSGSAALAQSYNAPAGIPAAAAPGGLEGRAAATNYRDAAEGRGIFGAPRGAYERDITTGSVRRPSQKLGQ